MRYSISSKFKKSINKLGKTCFPLGNMEFWTHWGFWTYHRIFGLRKAPGHFLYLEVFRKNFSSHYLLKIYESRRVKWDINRKKAVAWYICMKTFHYVLFWLIRLNYNLKKDKENNLFCIVRQFSHLLSSKPILISTLPFFPKSKIH